MKLDRILRKKGTRIVTVRMNETVEVAARILKRENIGALVVKDVCNTEGDTVVGMLSERDILRALVDRGQGVLAQPVSDLMSRTVISCGPSDDLTHVLELMEHNHIRHVPVLEEHTLVGVVSMRDFIALRLEELVGDRPASRDWTSAHPN